MRHSRIPASGVKLAALRNVAQTRLVQIDPRVDPVSTEVTNRGSSRRLREGIEVLGELLPPLNGDFNLFKVVCTCEEKRCRQAPEEFSR